MGLHVYCGNSGKQPRLRGYVPVQFNFIPADHRLAPVLYGAIKAVDHSLQPGETAHRPWAAMTVVAALSTS
jgi:hypothetical protein